MNNKMIFVNLAVKDMAKSIAFYEALGFQQNKDFSNEQGSAMVWSDSIWVMLLTHDFYQHFVPDKELADATSHSEVLLSLSMDSRDAVQQFADAATANGGRAYHVELPGNEAGNMFGYEVEDPDGHVWEPMWMDPTLVPHEEVKENNVNANQSAV